MQRFGDLEDLEKCSKMSIWLQQSASIQPITSPSRFQISSNFITTEAIQFHICIHSGGGWTQGRRLACSPPEAQGGAAISTRRVETGPGWRLDPVYGRRGSFAVRIALGPGRPQPMVAESRTQLRALTLGGAVYRTPSAKMQTAGARRVNCEVTSG